MKFPWTFADSENPNSWASNFCDDNTVPCHLLQRKTYRKSKGLNALTSIVVFWSYFVYKWPNDRKWFFPENIISVDGLDLNTKSYAGNVRSEGGGGGFGMGRGQNSNHFCFRKLFTKGVNNINMSDFYILYTGYFCQKPKRNRACG